MNAVAQQHDVEELIDFRALAGRAMKKRWWVAGCVVLFAAGFCAASFVLPPVYRATTVLVTATSDRGADLFGLASSPLGGLASGFGLGPRDPDTEEALAVLTSREFTERFIISENLMPKLISRLCSIPLPPGRCPPTLARAYKYFDTKIRSITQDRKTGLITMQIDWTDRNDAAHWSNQLISQLNDEMRRRAIAKADTSLEFLQKEVQATRTVEARDAISRLMEAQLKQRMLANVTQDYSFRVVDKAISSDGEEPIRPRKALLSGLGALVGLFVGIVCAHILTSADARRSH
jgi:uncharacterized protein involved in exopolysaccharide biosynthesis